MYGRRPRDAKVGHDDVVAKLEKAKRWYAEDSRGEDDVQKPARVANLTPLARAPRRSCANLGGTRVAWTARV